MSSCCCEVARQRKMLIWLSFCCVVVVLARQGQHVPQAKDQMKRGSWSLLAEQTWSMRTACEFLARPASLYRNTCEHKSCQIISSGQVLTQFDSSHILWDALSRKATLHDKCNPRSGLNHKAALHDKRNPRSGLNHLDTSFLERLHEVVHRILCLNSCSHYLDQASKSRTIPVSHRTYYGITLSLHSRAGSFPVSQSWNSADCLERWKISKVKAPLCPSTPSTNASGKAQDRPECGNSELKHALHTGAIRDCSKLIVVSFKCQSRRNSNVSHVV